MAFQIVQILLEILQARIGNEQFRWRQFHARASDDAQRPLDEQHADSQEARHATALEQNRTQIHRHLLLQRIYNKKITTSLFKFFIIFYWQRLVLFGRKRRLTRTESFFSKTKKFS